MRNVNVALWGFGAMASGIAKVLLEKEGVTVIGACDIDPRKIGKSIYELLGVEQGDRPDAFITDDISTLIDKEKCDICVIATDSFTKKVYPKVCYVVERGVNVITTAEEMSYPMAQDPELSDAMDILAKTNNVSILGTGINPGLMMDLLAVCLSGCMTHLDKVTCKRVLCLLRSLEKFDPVPIVGQHAFDEPVEHSAVVLVPYVGELVDHHVVDGRLGIGHEPPGEGQPILPGAAAEAGLGGGDRKARGDHAHAPGVVVDLRGQDDLGLLHVEGLVLLPDLGQVLLPPSLALPGSLDPVRPFLDEGFDPPFGHQAGRTRCSSHSRAGRRRNPGCGRRNDPGLSCGCTGRYTPATRIP